MISSAPQIAARVLVILPTYNEAENIVALCEQILALPMMADVMVVDDSSPDGTADLVRGVAQRFPNRVRLEVRPAKSGRGSAVVRGFAVARSERYDFCVEMDVDFSHDPADLPRLLAAMPHADLVVGSRNIPGGGVIGWPWRRKLIHWLASCYARVLLGRTTSDQTNGFRMYRVSNLADFPTEWIAAAGYVGQTLRAFVYRRRGLRVVDVPTIFHERRGGKSKMSWQEALRGAWAIARYRMVICADVPKCRRTDVSQ